MKILTLKQIYERVKEEDLKQRMYRLGFHFLDKYHYRTIYNFLKMLKETPSKNSYYNYFKKHFRNIDFYTLYTYLKSLNWFTDYKFKKRLFVQFDATTKQVLDIFKELEDKGYVQLTKKTRPRR